MRTLPYGSWPSPISADDLVSDTGIGLSLPRVDGDDLYWVQARASEGGRNEVVRRTPDGAVTSVTRAPWNTRSRVHEYGGGHYGVRGGVVIFAHLDDLRLYRVDVRDLSAPPVPITPAGAFRFAEPVIDLPRRQVFAIREDHTNPSAPVNTLVLLDLDGDNPGGGRILFSGTDFVAAPDLSADGRRLTWDSWNLPKMPWESSTVHRADLDADGLPTTIVDVTDGSTWVQQPRWSPDGVLWWIEEVGEWANLMALDLDAEESGPRRFPADGLQFGQPNWFLGARDYDFLPDGRVVANVVDTGANRLVLVEPASGGLEAVPTELVFVNGLAVTADGRVLSIGATESSSTACQLLTLPVRNGDSRVTAETLLRSDEVEVDAGYVSRAEEVTWTNSHGLTVHGFYYPPANADASAPEGERPPLLVTTHGGPTGMTFPSYTLGRVYWTSRGFAILDVNYGGSTGFGRSYRERLNGEWGVVDVDDSVTGALAMVEQGRADRNRLAIRGGSAGGFTTLQALTSSDIFAAGASHYGIGDLESLARETHKFESRYLDSIIGPYPECKDVYADRSPIHHVDRLNSPMILFQGTEDKAVPPNQATRMADALRAKGLPVALVMFEGEGHGFRKADNIKRCLEDELSFYAQVFGFEPADPITPVPIDSL